MTYRALALLTLCGLPLAFACDPGGDTNAGGGGTTTTTTTTTTSAPPVAPACGMETTGSVSVASTAPADQEAPVLRMFTFEVKLSAQVDCAANAGAKFTLKKGDATLALTDPVCEGAPTAFHFQPKADLEYLAEYTLLVEGLMGKDGEAIPTCAISFTTKSKTTAVGAGNGAHGAVDADGALWTWGDSLNAALDGRATPTIPARTPLAGKVVSFASGWDFMVAALEDGTVWAWGNNERGQLGDGTSTDSGSVPVKVALPANVKIKRVTASSDHALGLADDGTVWGWGNNTASELSGGPAPSVSPPQLLAGVTGAVGISANAGSPAGGHSLVLLGDGTVVGLGSNNHGALGILPEYGTYGTPIAASGISGAKLVSAGSAHGYVVTADGKGVAWGRPGLGGLGNGTCQIGTPTLAAPISGPGGTGQLDKLLTIDGGYLFALALRDDGTVWGWGDDLQGVLGDGTTGGNYPCVGGSFNVTNSRIYPVQATGITTAVGASAGFNTALVVLADGTVLGAGSNTNRGLGIPEPAPNGPVTTFTKVPGL